MNEVEDLELAREDLGALLVEVLTELFGAEFEPADPDAAWPQGPEARVRLMIHDVGVDSHTRVEVRTDLGTARVLAGLMLQVSEPADDDLLDVIGELGNILGGNVKTLLRHSARLSLPIAELLPEPSSADHPPGEVSVGAGLGGRPVVLTVGPANETYVHPWPGQASLDVLENRS